MAAGRYTAGFALKLVDAALMLSLILVPAIWIATPLRLPALQIELPWQKTWLLLPILLLCLRITLKRVLRRHMPDLRGLAEAELYKKFALLLVTPFLFFVALEQALEMAGFEAHFSPIVVRGDDDTESGGNSTEGPGLTASDEFRWQFQPGVVWRGRKVNSLGFLDREVSREKAADTIRVICMGDSITAQGDPPYSGRLHELLQSAPPNEQPWEAFNMAVHGYSSVIGLRLFERRGTQLAPDVVTLYYGWNDHWRGGSMPDRVRLAERTEGRWAKSRAAIDQLLQKKRIGQWVLSKVQSRRTQAASQAGGYLRVPPDEYRETLTQFVAAIRAAGAVPILITAPRTERPAQLLVERGNADSIEELIRLHDQYVDLTRQVAQQENVPLLDLAEEFQTLDKSTLMQADGIHMTRAGLDLIAERLHQTLTDLAAQPDWKDGL